MNEFALAATPPQEDVQASPCEDCLRLTPSSSASVANDDTSSQSSNEMLPAASTKPADKRPSKKNGDTVKVKSFAQTIENTLANTVVEYACQFLSEI